MWKFIVKAFKPHKLTKKEVRRFRVLILGPANAGKTTLLERLTDSPAGASIVTRNGKRIMEVPRGYDQRGIHTIDDEITYTSNPDLVFHDSGGFEAGGVKEVEAVWQFIRKRSLASPSQQLHAIWLCIPTDNDRPFGFLRSGFFSEPTASVPVIGIFTKLDGRKTKIMTEVLGPDPEQSDFLDRAPEVEQKVTEFVNRLETQFRNQRYPPAGFLRVGNMHEVTKRSVELCDKLLQATMDALPNETQRLLLGLTVWKRNRRVHTIYVLLRVLDDGVGGNIMTKAPGPGEDEESQLCADKKFRILMELYGCENDYEYKAPDNLDGEHHLLEEVYRRDGPHLDGDDDPPDDDDPINDDPDSDHHDDYPVHVDHDHRDDDDYYYYYYLPYGPGYHPYRYYPRDVEPEDLANGSKACVPFLKQLHPQSIPSNENAQYLVFICLVILWIRGGRNADFPNAHKTEHTASSIYDQIKDDGGFQGSASFNIARKLAKIIDEYTAL